MSVYAEKEYEQRLINQEGNNEQKVIMTPEDEVKEQLIKEIFKYKKAKRGNYTVLVDLNLLNKEQIRQMDYNTVLDIYLQVVDLKYNEFNEIIEELTQFYFENMEDEPNDYSYFDRILISGAISAVANTRCAYKRKRFKHNK